MTSDPRDAVVEAARAVLHRFACDDSPEASNLRSALRYLDAAGAPAGPAPYRCHYSPDCDMLRAAKERDRLRAELARAEADSALRSAQVLMIGSEALADPKIDPADRGDPRWTPTLEAVSQLRADLARVEAERDAAREQAGMHAQNCTDLYSELRAALTAACIPEDRDGSALFWQERLAMLVAERNEARYEAGTLQTAADLYGGNWRNPEMDQMRTRAEAAESALTAERARVERARTMLEALMSRDLVRRALDGEP